jgi:hypothetical protein
VRLVGVTAAITVLAYTAVLVRQNLYIAAAIRSFVSAQPTASVGSAVLDPAFYDSLRSAGSSVSDGALDARTAATLLVVVRSDCQSCIATVDLWRDALSRHPPRTTIHVWIAGPDLADQFSVVPFRLPDLPAIPSAKQATGTVFRLLRIRDGDRYAAATGVTVVPMSLMVDASGAILAAIRGTPSSDGVIRALEKLGRTMQSDQMPAMLIERHEDVNDLVSSGASVETLR